MMEKENAVQAARTYIDDMAVAYDKSLDDMLTGFESNIKNVEGFASGFKDGYESTKEMSSEELKGELSNMWKEISSDGKEKTVLTPNEQQSMKEDERAVQKTRNYAMDSKDAEKKAEKARKVGEKAGKLAGAAKKAAPKVIENGAKALMNMNPTTMAIKAAVKAVMLLKDQIKEQQQIAESVQR